MQSYYPQILTETDRTFSVRGSGCFEAGVSKQVGQGAAALLLAVEIRVAALSTVYRADGTAFYPASDAQLLVNAFGGT